jgi:hypothetical protein
MDTPQLRRYGRASVVLSYLVLPVIFAPAAFYCGHRLRSEDPEAGQRLIGLAMGSVVAWILVFYIVF